MRIKWIVKVNSFSVSTLEVSNYWSRFLWVCGVGGVKGNYHYIINVRNTLTVSFWIVFLIKFHYVIGYVIMSLCHFLIKFIHLRQPQFKYPLHEAEPYPIDCHKTIERYGLERTQQCSTLLQDGELYEEMYIFNK